MTDRTTRVQQAAQLVGAAFLAVGILGFVPGVTTNLYDGLHVAGHTGDAELLGVFHVSVLHNVVHLLFGVAGLALAKRADSARTFLLGGGAIYLVLWVYGLVIDKASDANFVPVDSADDWLHFGLGAAMVGLGLLLGRTVTGRRDVRVSDVGSHRAV
jgi:hypothetical protein